MTTGRKQIRVQFEPIAIDHFVIRPLELAVFEDPSMSRLKLSYDKRLQQEGE